MSKLTSIDLTRFRSANSKVLSGRDEGYLARKQLDIDSLDKTGEQYNVIIPKDTWAFNSSFFLGLFGDSVRNLGEVGFKQKYKFNCNESLLDDIEEGIKTAIALNGKSALG